MNEAAAAAGSRGGRVKVSHAGIRALTVEVSTGELAALGADPSVQSVSSDARVRGAQLEPGALLALRVAKTGGATGSATHLRDTLGLSGGPDGAGIRVALIDSGLQRQDAFANRVLESRDFTGEDRAHLDDFGHGTHVAGLIGGAGMGGDGDFAGVAPGVEFVVLKVLDAQGYGRTSDAISAVEYAIANQARLGIDLINLSLGHPIYEAAATDPLVLAVEAASRAGIIVVVSAGNYGRNPETGVPGYAGITSPGNAASAITVGAVRTNGTTARADDRVAGYSSRGPTWFDARVKPDLVAPGDKLGSAASVSGTLYKDYPSLQLNRGYLQLSGTWRPALSPAWWPRCSR